MYFYVKNALQSGWLTKIVKIAMIQHETNVTSL